jgi:hypothetical protein
MATCWEEPMPYDAMAGIFFWTSNYPFIIV